MDYLLYHKRIMLILNIYYDPNNPNKRAKNAFLTQQFNTEKPRKILALKKQHLTQRESPELCQKINQMDCLSALEIVEHVFMYVSVHHVQLVKFIEMVI